MSDGTIYMEVVGRIRCKLMHNCGSLANEQRMNFATIIVAVSVLVVIGCASDTATELKWKEFKAKHGKQYAAYEDMKHKEVFLSKDAEIEAHNARYAAGEVSYSRKHNQYSDLTAEEFRKYATGFVPEANPVDIPYVDEIA